MSGERTSWRGTARLIFAEHRTPSAINYSHGHKHCKIQSSEKQDERQRRLNGSLRSDEAAEKAKNSGRMVQRVAADGKMVGILPVPPLSISVMLQASPPVKPKEGLRVVGPLDSSPRRTSVMFGFFHRRLIRKWYPYGSDF
jgi:hypothetical protein